MALSSKYTVYKHTNKANGTVHNYDSINEAGESLGIRPNTITRYLCGLRLDRTGRRWSFCL